MSSQVILRDHMVSSPPNRLIVPNELNLVSQLFHRINRIIPANQHLLTIPPDMTARDAIALLRKHGYSQIPVVDGREVLGVFSHRSFAQKAAEPTWQELSKCAPGDLAVEEYLERFDFARVTEDMQQVFDAIDRDNGVLIGTEENLQGILTPMDFLHYLYKIASPFVMLSEIELALRALMGLAVSQDELEECAARSLSQLYENKVMPKYLEEMTFDNYKVIISNRDNWPKFESYLGGSRERTTAKLKQLCELRNDVFHFRREITLHDHETLSNHRDWLLLQVKKAELHYKAGGQS